VGRETNVRVLYFASARELASRSAESITLPEGASVGDAAKEINRLHPKLRSLKSAAKYSVNYVLTGEAEPLNDGDELGVLPPVAGG